jgi:hypothetical protein
LEAGSDGAAFYHQQTAAQCLQFFQSGVRLGKESLIFADRLLSLMLEMLVQPNSTVVERADPVLHRRLHHLPKTS